MEASEHRPRTYGNWRKPESPGLGQLGSIGTAILFVGMVAVIIAMMVGGLLAAAIVGLVVGAFLAVLMLRDGHGRSGVQRIANRLGWLRARSTGTNVYRSGPLGRVHSGTFQLPGLLAPSQLSEWQDSYGRPFALLHIPATRHFTAVLATEPDGASLVDEEQIDIWVAQWGMWLAHLGNEPGIVAASVTVETAPDSGTRLRSEVELNADPNAPKVAQAMLRAVIDGYPAGSATVKAWVALTWSESTRDGGRRRDADALAREIASRLPGLTQGLQATGAGAVRPVTAQELCELVRVAYDPAAARLIDTARAAGQIPDLSWDDAGPTAGQAAWNHYRHDGAWSVSWSMTAAPRGEVYSSILSHLIAPQGDIDRKRVTLLYRPKDAAQAARIVEQDKRNADFRATASNRPSARDLVAQRAAAATAREEALGAGLVNFGAIVTATVTSEDRLADARAAIDNLAATARLRLRPVYGSQDSAFAAGLPLGLVLTHHIKVPAEIRESL